MKTRFIVLFGLFAILILPIYATGVGCGSDETGQIDPGTAFADLDSDGIPDTDDPDADGDGVENNLDCNDMDASINPGAVDVPDAGYVDANCDGVDGDVDKAVWVASDGDDANPGTIDKPFKTIMKGVNSASGKDVYVASGTYVEDVELTNNISLYGGFGPLEGATRKRNVNDFTSTISGVNNYKTQVLVLNATPFTIHASLLAKSTNSTVDGFTILGDDTTKPQEEGVAVISYNSNLTISNNKIFEAAPAAVKIVNAGVVISLDGAATDNLTTTITGNEIEMKGVGSISNGRDFGVAVLPSDGAAKNVSLNVISNKITESGNAEITIGIHAASTASIKLDVDIEKNTITMNGGGEVLCGVDLGSLMADNVIPVVDSVHVNTAKILENVVDINVGMGSLSFAIGLSVEQALGAVSIEKNALEASNLDGGAAYLLILINSSANVLNNTLKFDGTANSENSVAVATYNAFATDPGFPPNTLGNFNNNTFAMTCKETGAKCQMLGFIEASDLSFNASPKEFKNNVFDYDLGTGITFWGYYADSLPPNNKLITDVGSLNDKSGLLDPVNDPTVFEGNTAE